MRDGHILQCDRPQQLYAKPNNLFIAAFIGSPAMNLVEATYDDGAVRFGQFSVAVPAAPTSGRFVLGIRPESFEDATFAPGLPTIEVEVVVVEELGSDAHVFFRVAAPPITAEVLESASEGALLGSNEALFTARVDARSPARVGDRMRLAVDPERFHYFDAETGNRLAHAGAAELVSAR
jgi:multiple sugar transport system ATP-binding protein